MQRAAVPVMEALHIVELLSCTLSRSPLRTILCVNKPHVLHAMSRLFLDCLCYQQRGFEVCSLELARYRARGVGKRREYFAPKTVFDELFVMILL